MNGATPGGPSVVMTSRLAARTAPLVTTREVGRRLPGPRRGRSAAGTAWPARRRRPATTGHRTRGSRLAPGREEPTDERHRIVERVRPEEDPAETDELEGHEALPGHGDRAARLGWQPARPPGVERLKCPTDCPSPWIAAPDDEGPGRAVPEPAEQHGDHDVAVQSRSASPGCRRAGCTGSRAASERVMCQRRQKSWSEVAV